MDDKTINRIGIAASIVGAVGAIAFLIRRPISGAPGQTGATGPAGAATTIVGAAGTPGSPGLPGTAGAAGAAGEPGAVGAPGPAAASNSIPGSDLGGTPGVSYITQYFVSQFYPPPAGTLRPDTLTYNTPPRADLGKQYMGVASSQPKKGCGCGGKKSGCGGGCGGASKCPNAAPPFSYPDGAGGCLSSTYGRLIDSIEKCVPGYADSALSNMASTMYFGYDTTPAAAVDAITSALSTMQSRSGQMLEFFDAPPPVRLGTTS